MCRLAPEEPNRLDLTLLPETRREAECSAQLELAAQRPFDLAAPPLARALYKHTELGDSIPEALYTAVAEVLAYVYQLRRYRKGDAAQPEEPHDLPVPPELDPANSARGIE
mgnify:CR=1 FL=1